MSDNRKGIGGVTHIFIPARVSSRYDQEAEPSKTMGAHHLRPVRAASKVF